MKKIVAFIFVGLLAFLMFACVGKDYTLSISNADKSITLTEGDSRTVVPVYTEGATLVWESSNNDVVTVLEGKITAISEGSAVVTVTLKENSKLKVEITVTVNKKEEVKEFTVTFKEDNSSVKVIDGEKVTKPADPVKDGYEFKGWFTDEACTVAYDFNEPVTADLDLYAKWEKLPVIATVAEILASEETLFEVTGYVAAINARSFILKDSTGAMLVYRGSKWTVDVAVGDAVKVTGSVSTYGGAKQFGDAAVVVKDGTAVVDHGEVKELDGAAVDAYASLEAIKAEYVKVEGILSVSGNYLNLTIEGATVIGSLTYPVDADAIKALADKKVAVTGYVTGITGSNTKYFNILFTNVEEVIENVKVTINWGITSAEIGLEFYNDFCKYAGTVVPFDTFQKDSHPAVKDALSNAEMLAKWKWLFEYMKADLESMENPANPDYVNDTILMLEKLIAGDTEAIKDSAAPGPNGRTLIRSYVHGIMHNSKGSTDNVNFAEVSPDFSDPAVQKALVEALYASIVKLSDNQKLAKPVDPTRPEYDFLGWYTDEACTIEYDFDQIVTKDLTLYAKWELSKYNVTFTGIDSTVEVTRGEVVAKPADPVKEGHFFRGWFVDEELTTLYDFDDPVLSNLVLYPKFEEQLSEYNITLAHGLTSADIGMLFYIDFNKYANAEVPYETFLKNSHPAIKDALSNAEMLAKWKWLFEYMKADLESMTEPAYPEFVSDTISLLEKLIAGDTEAIKDSVAPGPNGRTLIRSYMHGVMNNSKGSTDNANFALVSPDFSDETVQKALVEAYYKSAYKVTVFEKFVKPADPVKFEYEFMGWFTDEACTKPFDFETQIIDNYTLYALWKPTFEMYKVTFDSINLTVEVKENKTVAKPDVPERVGYSFVGWYSDELYTTEFDFNTPITADTVIYGKWIGVETFTVTFDLDGGVFEDGYKTSAEIGKAFYDDFVKYAGKDIPFDTFHDNSSSAIKTALANAEMLAKWQWLWIYMLEDLKAFNGSNGGSYTADTYELLAKLAQGDKNVITLVTAPGPNGRTLLRAYMHGVMHSMKGCGSSNATFASYCPDYSNADVQKALVLAQFGTQMKVTAGNLIPSPTKEGYKFDGWYTNDGTKVTVVEGNVTVKAKWVETVLVSDIAITNKINELELLKTYQLTWTIAPEDAINKLVKFESSNPEVATIDSNGVITAVSKGTTTIKVVSLSASGKSDEFVLEVTVPAYFDISYETESYVEIGNEVLLNCEYIDGKNKGTIVWTSLNPEIATVDAQGKVTGVADGVATIRASVEGKEGVYQDLYVTVVPENLSDAMKLVLASHNSNAFIRYELGIGAGVPNYYTDVISSVNKLLFEKFVVNKDYNKVSNEKYGAELESRKMDSIEFIVVHYTAGFNTTAGAKAHIEYFAQPLSQNATSIHYTTGNDGIYKGIDEQYKAAHAGDSGSGSEFAWRDTDVVVLDTDPVIPVVTITSKATFAINGRDTGIKVPEETKFNRGFVTDNKWLNDLGLAVNKKDGKYQLGTAWWCYSQIAEGRICSNGGNGNGIGIETAVNYGSDLWYTWQKTAMLVADIMIRNNLDISKVKGHHFFSGKDCPQPLLENDLEIWNEFIKMVQSEYERMSKYSNCEFDFVCSNPNVNQVGRIIKQELTSQVVQYTITVFNNDTDKQETITLSTIVEGIYAK